jgi:ketosteroid isomerase-like protein
MMGAEQNIETTKAMYEAFGRGDVNAILEVVTDDVDWSTDAAIESAPWYGPKHGKAGVRSFFEGIGQTGPVTELTPLSFASNDDGDVMTFIRNAFTVTATGKSGAMNLHHYWKFRDEA